MKNRLREAEQFYKTTNFENFSDEAKTLCRKQGTV